ncbi:hypothetical protein OKW49_006837 [Paraburkholderia youngii]
METAETVELAPQVLANRVGVAFSLVFQNRPVECMITITALEAYFWLDPRAGDERILIWGRSPGAMMDDVDC